MQELTYENIVHNLGVKIQAIQNEIQQLRDTKGLGFDKFGRMISLETDLKYYQMLKKACEKQVAIPVNRTHGFAECPICELQLEYRLEYCADCGRKLDWEEKK